MRIRTVTLSAAAIACVALAGCGGSGDKTAGAPAVPSSAPSSAAAPTSSAPSSDSSSAPASSAPSSAPSSAQASASAKAAKPVKVDKSFNDTVMGDKGTVLEVIRNYQPSAASLSKYSSLADEEVVLVEVKVTSSSKYYDSVGATSFYIEGAPGTNDASTTILDSEIKAKGYKPLPDAEEGKSTSGWIVFTPDKGGKHLKLDFKRLAAKTSDGKSIPAKDFMIPLD